MNGEVEEEREGESREGGNKVTTIEQILISPSLIKKKKIISRINRDSTPLPLSWR